MSQEVKYEYEVSIISKHRLGVGSDHVVTKKFMAKNERVAKDMGVKYYLSHKVEIPRGYQIYDLSVKLVEGGNNGTT